MKRIIPLFAVTCLSIGVFSCAETSTSSHDDLLGKKEIKVDAESFDVGWQGDTLSIPFEANCYWGIDFLTWEQEILDNGDEIQKVSPAKWMTTPAIYGMGNRTVDIKVAANLRSNRTRKGYIKFFTGDDDVYHYVTVTQAGNPDWSGPELEPLELFFDFTQNSMNWPTTSQTIADDLIYPLKGVDYHFSFQRCSMGAYLVIFNSNCSLGLPALENYRLTKVVALISSNNKSVRHATISKQAAVNDPVQGGEDQTWPAQPSVEITYNLMDTEYNTRYYLYCVSGGLPTAGVTLYYEP